MSSDRLLRETGYKNGAQEVTVATNPNDNRIVTTLSAAKDGLDKAKEVVLSATTLALSTIACFTVLAQECANLTHTTASMQTLSTVSGAAMCTGPEVHTINAPGHTKSPKPLPRANSRGE
jgi:hypothetical protein